MKRGLTILFMIAAFIDSVQGFAGPFNNMAEFSYNNWDCYISTVWDSLEDIASNPSYNPSYENLSEDEKMQVETHIERLSYIVVCNAVTSEGVPIGNLRIESAKNGDMLLYRQCYVKKDEWYCEGEQIYPAIMEVDY